MKRLQPAQLQQAQPPQRTAQRNVKWVSQRVPHPAAEKLVPRLPPPPEPRHLLEPAASTEGQCADKPAVRQQELLVNHKMLCEELLVLVNRRMLSEEVSEPQQAVPYKALKAPLEGQGSRAIKHSFDTSAEIDIDTNASSCEFVTEHPAKRFKPLSLSSMGSLLCDAVTTASSAIVTTLLDSDSTAMLSVDDESENRPTAALDLLATVCQAEIGSAAGFSTGNGRGMLIDPWLLDNDNQSSTSVRVSSGWELTSSNAMWGFVMMCAILHTRFFLPTFSISNPELPQLGLSLCCLLGAIGCSFLPVWAKKLFRKLSLDTDHSHNANEVRARSTLAYFYYVLPWFQAALAYHTYRESGSIKNAILSHLVMPGFAIALGWSHLVRKFRRVMLFCVFPVFCIQGTVPYELYWLIETTRWHLAGAMMNTSLIVPLQESLFMLAGILVLDPPGLIIICSIIVGGMVASCAKILWQKTHLSSCVC